MNNEDPTSTKTYSIGIPSKTTSPNEPNANMNGTTESAVPSSKDNLANYLKSVHFRAILVGVCFPHCICITVHFGIDRDFFIQALTVGQIYTTANLATELLPLKIPKHENNLEKYCRFHPALCVGTKSIDPALKRYIIVVFVLCSANIFSSIYCALIPQIFAKSPSNKVITRMLIL